MRNNPNNIWLFLLGLGSETQIRLIGSAGISEFVVFAFAPIIFLQDYGILRRDKFLPAIWLSIAALLGCVISSLVNHTPVPYMVRGMATAYSLFAIPVVLHRLLRDNLAGIRWLFLGIAISGVITIFAFYNATELSQYSAGVATKGTSEALAGGQLFVLAHFGAWTVLPVQGWYFSTPTPYLVIAPLILTIYTIITSASGRSAILVAMFSSMLILLVKKKVDKMYWLQKNFVFTSVLSVLLLFSMASLYKYAGRAGLLNEAAQRKYETQMSKRNGSGGMLQMIMGGRIEFFVGLYACIKNPIVGRGPWALDRDGLYGEFLSKYGAPEDYEQYIKDMNMYASIGLERVGMLPAHSHVIGFWLANGILGLPYWLYVLYLMYNHFRRHLAAIPQYYGYFAIMIPSMMWNIFFSPYGARVGGALFVTALLLARAVDMGRVRLPIAMYAEAQRKNVE